MKVKIIELSPFALDFLMRLELLRALYSQLWVSLSRLEEKLKENKDEI